MSTAKTLTSLKHQYHGLEWQNIALPTEFQRWIPRGNFLRESGVEPVARLQMPQTQHGDWQWPQRDICVLTDLHADADALLSSLVASGCIKKTGPMDNDIKFTKAGKNTLFVIDGDCFDKGPSNLRLLRTIKMLIDAGAKVKIIAGNHDIRFLAGMEALDKKADSLLCHFFIRMAPKGITFLHEIYLSYVQRLSARKRAALGENLSSADVRKKLYPDADWEKVFPEQAKGLMSEYKIKKEIAKVRQKQHHFEALCTEYGMTLSMVYAAINKWRELFLDSKGEFYWFFDNIKLLHTEGSFLFAHAGVDDVIARELNEKGVKRLNKKFHKALKSDLFYLYYSPMGNVFRSKYREGDWEFTAKGAKDLNDIGIKAIVHGHINRHQGQELFLREGILNFECDASLDYRTRQKEGLTGRGAAATLIKKDRSVLGVSVDYPYIKVFAPDLADGNVGTEEGSHCNNEQTADQT